MAARGGGGGAPREKTHPLGWSCVCVCPRVWSQPGRPGCRGAQWRGPGPLPVEDGRRGSPPHPPPPLHQRAPPGGGRVAGAQTLSRPARNFAERRGGGAPPRASPVTNHDTTSWPSGAPRARAKRRACRLRGGPAAAAQRRDRAPVGVSVGGGRGVGKRAAVHPAAVADADGRRPARGALANGDRRPISRCDSGWLATVQRRWSIGPTGRNTRKNMYVGQDTYVGPRPLQPPPLVQVGGARSPSNRLWPVPDCGGGEVSFAGMAPRPKTSNAGT